MQYKENLSSKELFLLTIGTCLGVFVVSVDGFIINIALPTIAGELGVRDEISIWLLTFFTLPYTIAVPLAGNLCVLHSTKRVFLWGLEIFIIGSIFCSFAHSYNYLLACRVLQGFGAGMTIPSSRGLVVLNFPPDKRVIPLMFWAFSVVVGPAFGPVIGGLFSNVHWHWLFLVSMPLALVCLLLVHTTATKTPLMSKYRLDWTGFSLMALIVLSIQVILDRGQVYDWLHSPIIVIALVTFCVLTPFFLVWEYFFEKPMIYIQAFAKRNFSIAIAANCISLGCCFASFTLDIFWLHHFMGYPPLWTGLTIVPIGFFPILIYPFMSRALKQFDVHLIAFIGALAFVVGFYMKSRVNLEVSFLYLATARFIQGLGFPFLISPNSMMYSRGIPDKQLPIITSFYSFSRMLISGLAISMGMTLWIHRRAFYQTRLAARTYFEGERFTTALSNVEPIVTSTHQAVGIVNHEVMAQAATLGLADIYYLFTWACAAVCLLVFCYDMKVGVGVKTLQSSNETLPSSRSK